MNLRQEIYHHIQSYLDDEISVTAFEEWFIPATWHVDVERDADFGPVVSYVTSILADFKDDEISEAALRHQLSETAHTASMNSA